MECLAIADTPISGLSSGGGLRATDNIPVERESGNVRAKVAPVVLLVAMSDETSALTSGANVVTIRAPFPMTLTSVRASVNVAPSGSSIIVDINESGASILSTKLSIDDSETTSTTAATPAVISDADIADDAEISFDIDQIGAVTAGAGLKVMLIGHPT